MAQNHRQQNNFKYIIAVLCLLFTITVMGQTKSKTMRGLVPKGYVIWHIKALPNKYYLLLTEKKQNINAILHFQVPIILVKDSAGMYIYKGKFVTDPELNYGEGFKEIRVKENSFTIISDIYDKVHADESITFCYNSRLDMFFLSKYERTYINGGDENDNIYVTVKYRIDKRLPFGKVTIDSLQHFELYPQSRKLLDKYWIDNNL